MSQLIILAFAMAAGGYVRTALSPLQETMRVALALSDNQMAILQGPAIGIPALLSAIPLGLLIDRYSRVKLLWTLLLLSLAGSLATAFVTDFSFLLAARMVAGLCGINVVPVAYSLLADLYPPARRGRAMTILIVGQVAGNSAAFALGGGLLSLTGEGGGGWRWAMLGLSTILLVPLAALLLMREPVRFAQEMQNKESRPQVDFRQLLDPPLLLLAFGIMLVETAVGATLIWSAPMLARDFELDPAGVGTLMATAMLMSGLAGPALGGFAADFLQKGGGPPRTAAALAIVSLLSAPLCLFALAPSVASVTMLLFAQMTMLLTIAVAGITLFTIIVPAPLQGLGNSCLMAGILFCALAVGPPMVSLLSNALGGLAMITEALSIVSAAVLLIAAALFATVSLLLRFRGRDVAWA